MKLTKSNPKIPCNILNQSGSLVIEKNTIQVYICSFILQLLVIWICGMIFFLLFSLFHNFMLLLLGCILGVVAGFLMIYYVVKGKKKEAFPIDSISAIICEKATVTICFRNNKQFLLKMTAKNQKRLLSETNQIFTTEYKRQTTLTASSLRVK